MKITRVAPNPIISKELHPSLGDNINGPSLIRVPSWVDNPLGRYYLYFAHHRGEFIRLAYADAIEGPWSIHAPGVLNLEDSTCLDHVASPDVHVDESRREIRMYFHGVEFASSSETDGHEHQFGEAGRWIGNQRSKLATSTDGLRFSARAEPLGTSYFRAFSFDGWYYALGMPGVFYRSRDGIRDFEVGPICFSADFRHAALHLSGHTLHVFHSMVGDMPERIVHSTIDLRPHWLDWHPTPATTVLEPEMHYEGATLPLQPSVRGPVFEPVRELRDPAIFEDDGQLFLLYAIAGEQGIAIARLEL